MNNLGKSVIKSLVARKKKLITVISLYLAVDWDSREILVRINTKPNELLSEASRE